MFPKYLQLVFGSLLFGLPAVGYAAPAPQTLATEASRLEAQHGMRVEIESLTTQDPVVFTDLAPFVSDDPPVRLPPDQDLE